MTTPTYRDITGSAAENYERYFAPTIATALKADLLAIADLRPGERVVDVACGTGVIARAASELVGPKGSVTGVDLAPDMIAVARATSPSSIDWRESDAANLPLASGSQDAVLCQLGLMFLGNLGPALAEMRRVLVPGGRVVANTPGAMQPPFEQLERGVAEHVGRELGGFVRAVFSMPDPAALSASFEDAGLVDVRAELRTTRLVLPPPREFLWQYVSLTPLAELLGEAPAAAQAALERDFVAGCEAHLVDGQLVIDQPTVIATGTR